MAIETEGSFDDIEDIETHIPEEPKVDISDELRQLALAGLEKRGYIEYGEEGQIICDLEKPRTGRCRV